MCLVGRRPLVAAVSGLAAAAATLHHLAVSRQDVAAALALGGWLSCLRDDIFEFRSYK